MLFIPYKHLYISGTSYVSADEPDYKEVITDANSRRRMGRLLKMAVWCGLKSLDGVPSERVAGIITSTGAGFMKDTISFGSSIFDREETLLNPSPFMQSTFNTASGYIALIRKIHAYNTTYVQQADGFAASLLDAAMLLDDAGEGNVALVGAFDEVTPEVDVIRQRLGYIELGTVSFRWEKALLHFCSVPRCRLTFPSPARQLNRPQGRVVVMVPSLIPCGVAMKPALSLPLSEMAMKPVPSLPLNGVGNLAQSPLANLCVSLSLPPGRVMNSAQSPLPNHCTSLGGPHPAR